VEDFEALADEIEAMEERVTDAIFTAIREQMRGDSEAAVELEKRLSKVRRSLRKAQKLLRTGSDDD
jgi:hypothetical protein